MPSADFFAHLGFFVRRDFLELDSREQLLREVCEAPREPSLLVRDGVDRVLDHGTRSTTSALVAPATRRHMRERFLEITGKLAEHFGMPLEGAEPPGFLVYEPGAFFSAHTDTGADVPPDIRRRRVSAVLFLNGPSASSSDGGYEGGSLRFHGVLDGHHWEACPLAFDAEPGMLVAFRSDVVHEVLPVTSGQRFTIVTWFLAGEL